MEKWEIVLIFLVLILYFLCLYLRKEERNQHLEVIIVRTDLMVFQDIDSKEIISLKGGCENDGNVR